MRVYLEENYVICFWYLQLDPGKIENSHIDDGCSLFLLGVTENYAVFKSLQYVFSKPQNYTALYQLTNIFTVLPNLEQVNLSPLL